MLLKYQETLIQVLGMVIILLGLMFTGLLWRISMACRTIRLDYRPRSGWMVPRWSVCCSASPGRASGPPLEVMLTLATSSASAGRDWGVVCDDVPAPGRPLE